MKVFLLVVLLSLVGFSPQAASTVYDFHPNHIKILARAGAESYRTNYEQGYCLVGHRDLRNGHLKVDYVFRPNQRAFNWIGHGWYLMRDECPKGTIAFAHTHPPAINEEPDVYQPSITDRETAKIEPFGLNLIVYPELGEDGQLIIHISGWLRDSNGELQPYNL